jgi:hypothetical protein
VAGFQAIEYGAVVSTPSEVEPLKNSTRVTTPAAPVDVRSEAFAARVSCDPRLMLVPLVGEERLTVGAGFTGAGVGVGVGLGLGDGVGVGVGVVEAAAPVMTSA